MSKVSVHQRKARDFIQREDWANALTELQRLVAADGSNPNLHNQIGDIYLRQEDVARACEYFERAVDAYAAVGLHNNALALCKKVMRLRPARFEMRYRLARLRLDQGFRGEAAGYFRDYLEHVPCEPSHADAIESHCREMMELIPDEAPLPKVLEMLEGVGRYIAAFEIVRKQAQHAADAGDDAGAKRLTEKMRSLRLLVERTGRRDLISALQAQEASAPAPAGASPTAVEAEPLPAASLAPAVDSAVEPESPLAIVPMVDPVIESLPDIELAPPSAALEPSLPLIEPAPLLEPAPRVEPAKRLEPATRIEPVSRIEPAAVFEPAPRIEPTPDLEPEPATEVSSLDPNPIDRLWKDASSARPPAVEPKAAPAPAVERPRRTAPIEPPPDLDDASIPGAFADLALELGDTPRAASGKNRGFVSEPAVDADEQVDWQRAGAGWTEGDVDAEPLFEGTPMPAPDNGARASYSGASSVDPHAAGWVDALRRQPVWIPSDAGNASGTDPWKHGASMELESVIDSFREQMARALDGDGAARYDLGVAYFDMGLYNEALAEFEAAARCPGLEVQSYEMLAACLLQTGRHVEVVELLLPVLADEAHSPRGRVGLQYSLGLAYEALGDWEHARHCFEAVAHVDIDFKDVQVRLQRS